MDIFGVLTMIGGLALFLYGMEVLGDGLKKASGGKLEMILEKLTSNKLMAVLLGAGVTAIIQSSSATTVMVVGFVSSGIMSLSRAVGVILGANVGTTITAWILSLAEISGAGFLFELYGLQSSLYELIYSFSYVKHFVRGKCAAFKCKLITEHCLNLCNNSVVAVILFAELHSLDILKCLVENYYSCRFKSRSVVSGIYRKCISACEDKVCSAFKIGVNHIG